MARTPQQKIGDAWEKAIAKMFMGRVQVGSGNKWFAKLDVKVADFLISAKATEAESFRIDTDMLREMRSLRNIPGGVGPETTTVMMVKTAKDEVVVMELDDFMALVDRLDGDAELTPVKRHLRLVTDDKPQLLR